LTLWAKIHRASIEIAQVDLLGIYVNHLPAPRRQHSRIHRIQGGRSALDRWSPPRARNVFPSRAARFIGSIFAFRVFHRRPVDARRRSPARGSRPGIGIGCRSNLARRVRPRGDCTAGVGHETCGCAGVARPVRRMHRCGKELNHHWVVKSTDAESIGIFSSNQERIAIISLPLSEAAAFFYTFRPIDRINSSPLLFVTTPSRNVKSNFIRPFSISS